MECIRCSGLGKIKKFKHVDNGICFECDGKGYKLSENEIMIEFKIGNKVVDRQFYSKDTSKKIVMEHAKKIGATSIKATKLG
jgi:RecJ-like exonuclease